jgi:hypothetical protein
MKTPKRVRLAAIILFLQGIFLTLVLAMGLYVWLLIGRLEDQVGLPFDAIGGLLTVVEFIVGVIPFDFILPVFNARLTLLLGLAVLGLLVSVEFITSIGVWRRRRWAFLAVIGIAVVYFLFIIPPVGAFFMLFFTVPLVTPKSIKAFWGESGLNKAALQQVGNSAVQRGEQLRDQISESERLKQAGNSALKYGGQMRESVQTNESFQRFGAVTRDYADQVGRKLIKTDEVTADPEKVDIISDDRDVISAETPAPSHDNHTEPDLDSHTYPADTETDQAASGKQEAP